MAEEITEIIGFGSKRCSECIWPCPLRTFAGQREMIRDVLQPNEVTSKDVRMAFLRAAGQRWGAQLFIVDTYDDTEEMRLDGEALGRNGERIDPATCMVSDDNGVVRIDITRLGMPDIAVVPSDDTNERGNWQITCNIPGRPLGILEIIEEPEEDPNRPIFDQENLDQIRGNGFKLERIDDLDGLSYIRRFDGVEMPTEKVGPGLYRCSSLCDSNNCPMRKPELNEGIGLHKLVGLMVEAFSTKFPDWSVITKEKIVGILGGDSDMYEVRSIGNIMVVSNQEGQELLLFKPDGSVTCYVSERMNDYNTMIVRVLSFKDEEFPRAHVVCNWREKHPNLGTAHYYLVPSS